MWNNRQEKDIPSDAPIEVQAAPFLERRKRLSEMDFQKQKDVDVAIYCLNSNPRMVNDLNVDVESHLYVLKEWIKNDLRNYITCIKYKVCHIELLTLYITNKLKGTKDGVDGQEVTPIDSYDNKLVLNYQYETKHGETITYFDKVLGVPTSLIVKAGVKLKLVDAQKLVEKVDVDIKRIDLAIVTCFVTTILNRTVRDTILSFIDTKKMSFYDLPQHYTIINKEILDSLTNCFGECGLAAMDFSISDISVPDNTDSLLRNQFFAIAEAERVKAHEQRLESASLDLYERKAAIHNKYPNFPITLTESEKDLALNRYLTRIGKDTMLKADIKERRLTNRKVSNEGTATAERSVAPITVTKQSNGFRVFYAIMVSVLYIIAFAMFAHSTSAGLIALGCATLVSGLTACFCYNRLMYGSKREQIIKEDCERELEININQNNYDVAKTENKD